MANIEWSDFLSNPIPYETFIFQPFPICLHNSHPPQNLHSSIKSEFPRFFLSSTKPPFPLESSIYPGTIPHPQNLSLGGFSLYG